MYLPHQHGPPHTHMIIDEILERLSVDLLGRIPFNSSNSVPS